MAGAAETGRVTLQMRATPLRSALEQLRIAGGPVVEIDPAVPDTPITADLSDVPWSTALRTILRAGSGPGRVLEAQRTGEIYRVRLQAVSDSAVEVVAPPALPLFANRGSISFKNTPLRQVLRRIAAETRVRTQVEPKVEDSAVTVRLFNRPASELIAATLEAAGAQTPGLRYVWDGDHYVVWKCTHGYDGTRRPGQDGNEPEPEPGERIERLTLRFASVYQLSDLLGAELFNPLAGQMGPVNNQGVGAGVGEVAPPGLLPAGPGNSFLPIVNPPVLTGLCRYARCGPRFARETP